jgi:hypothetical protein
MTRGLSGVRADSSWSYRRLEGLAAHVREQLNLRADEAIDPLELFEDLHEISISRSNGVEIPLRGGVISLEDSEGYTRFDGGRDVLEILASERTYEWLEQGHPRAGYFVVHELGHCVLHTDQLVRLARMPTEQQAAFHRGRQGHRACDDTEWQANAFASALLMPAQGVAALERQNGGLTVSMIVERFRVSREAANYRIDLFTARRNELLTR